MATWNLQFDISWQWIYHHQLWSNSSIARQAFRKYSWWTKILHHLGWLKTRYPRNSLVNKLVHEQCVISVVHHFGTKEPCFLAREMIWWKPSTSEFLRSAVLHWKETKALVSLVSCVEDFWPQAIIFFRNVEQPKTRLAPTKTCV